MKKTINPRLLASSMAALAASASIALAFNGVWAQKQTMAAKSGIELSNLKQDALAAIMYSMDFDDKLPFARSTSEAAEETYPYSRNRTLYETLNPKGGVIAYNIKSSGRVVDKIPKAAQYPIWFDSKPWPNLKRAVAFLDGHAAWQTPAEWRKTVRLTKKSITAKRK